MDNQDITRQLDEQRMLYMYQGFNAIMKLLNQHLDQSNQVDTLTQAYQNADGGKIIAMAAMALKNGKITHQQYEKIFDAAMGIKTVDVPNPNHRDNWAYLEAKALLDQYRG